jgi:hypothetical protein
VATLPHALLVARARLRQVFGGKKTADSEIRHWQKNRSDDDVIIFFFKKHLFASFLTRKICRLK